MRKIKKGDAIIVIAGKEKGRTGEVLTVLKPKRRRDNKFSDLRVRVQGINLVKKCVKANPQQNVEGGIVEREAALQISNVALVNPKTGKADRVGIRTTEDGQKVRFFKSDGALVDK